MKNIKNINGLVRSVNFYNNAADFQVALMGEFGFSNKAIKQKTGFSDCQIYYRLRKARIKRLSYRNGDNDISNLVIAGTERTIGKKLRERASTKLITYFRDNGI